MAKAFQINRRHYLVLLIIAFYLYSKSLAVSPVHLNQDELMFALNANSISKNLTDFYGNSTPFYFWHLGSLWATPIIVYLASLVLKFFPFSEATVRLTSVLVGVFSIGVIMLLAERIFKSKFYGLMAGIFLAITPAFFIHSRLLLDNLYIVPFVLLWLYLLKLFLDKRTPVYLFFSTLSLGIGLHSYHAAKIIMPVYFALTVLVLIKNKIKDTNIWLILFSGFVLPILLFIPWLRKHPDTLLNQVNYVGSIDTSVNVGEGIWGVINARRLSDFSTNYISYFDPATLFVSGDKSPIHSTHKTGVFAFPFIFLIVFGALEIIYRKNDLFSRIILFGFLTFPIAPSLVNDFARISRGLIIIPFGVLVSLYGVKFFLAQKDKIFKTLLLALIFFSFVQFSIFLTDYFGQYRARSYSWFNNDIGGALESALRSTETRPVKIVYVDNQIPFVNYYFKFYEEKLGINMEGDEVYFDSKQIDFTKFPQGSLVVLKYNNAGEREEKIGGFEKIETIREPNGFETFYVYFRD